MAELLTQSEHHREVLERLYPDVARVRSVGRLLQASFTWSAATVTVEEMLTGLYGARVERGSRFSQVYLGATERLFISGFWDRGASLADAGTGDPDELAGAIAAWMAGCNTAELAGGRAWVRVAPAATAYEAGREVEFRWQAYLSNAVRERPDLAPFLAAAAEHPKLRVLFPVKSLNMLGFSRCTGYPFTNDIPHVRPVGAGQFQVLDPRERLLGTGNAEEAVALVVAHLPPGCGPAVPGTAADLEPPRRRGLFGGRR